MRQVRFILGMMVGLLHGGWVCAQAIPNPCEDAAGRWAREECESYRLQRSEDTLKQLYDALLQGAGPVIAVELQKGQKHWEELRGSHCGLVDASYGGGHGGEEGRIRCQREMAQQRIQDLRKLIELYLDTEN